MPSKVKVPFHKNNSKSSYQNHQNKLDNLKIQNQFSQNSELLQNNSEAENSHNLSNMQNNKLNENSNNSTPNSNSVQDSSVLDSSNVYPTNLELEKLQKEIIDLKTKNEDMTNRIFRMAADAQNSSKQEEINLGQTRKHTKKSVVNLILPFLDTLNLAFAFVPPTEDTKMQKFVQTLQNSFEKLIKDLILSGIELIIPKENDIFDPNIMMPLNSPELTDNQTENKENKIKRMVSIGIKIDGQVVRSASVMF